VKLFVGLVVTALALGSPADARAQASQPITEQESPEVTRAIELENSGKYRDAIPIYREAMRTHPTPIVVVGRARACAEHGMTDSLLAPLDSLLTRYPKEALYHVVHLRSYQILRRYDAMRAAFERWVHDDPRNASPYGTYARMLIEIGQPATADSVIERGRVALGPARDLQSEPAQLRAAMGDWETSAQAWRRTLANDAGLASAAAYSLAPAPATARAALRSIFGAAPVDVGARRALAELEITWGQPQAAWEALKVLPADTATATAWEEFGDRSMSEERYALARDALTAALRVRRTPALALKAATAALRAGSPALVLTLTPANEWGPDPATAARDYLPLHVEALAAMGRGADAERLVAKYDRYLAPGQHARMARLLASAWVRAGDLQRARAALGASGPDADSSDAAGLIALYEGRLDVARRMLRASQDQSADMALVMGIVSRTRGDNAPLLGAAFLALARGDSASAAEKFVEAAAQNPEAASALLLASSRIHAARGDAAGAIALWRRIVTEQGDAPEAAEAELEWARALRRSGDTKGATAHLEHLILSAPQSALLPQARRELELLRGSTPPG
jgi:tetratricopeptide (TPR) repeat protein